MSRRSLPILCVLAAGLFAGCGSAVSSSETPPPVLDAKAAPGTNGLQVTATSARIGDATQADDINGLTELKVPARKVDPGKLRQQVRKQQGVGAGASCADADLMPDANN